MPSDRLSITKHVPLVLQSRPNERLKAREIAELLLETYPQACANKRANSQRDFSDKDFLDQIASEIGAQRRNLLAKHPELRNTEGRPRRYYWSTSSELDEIEDDQLLGTEPRQLSTSGDNEIRISEHDLYPILSFYLERENDKVYTMRINESRSSNQRGSGGNRWLYPDLVGVQDLGAEWDREVLNVVEESRAVRTRLWSFEVKLKLNVSNVREAYFQAVSNSSWANRAYLVTAEIQNEQTLKELRVLSGVHGVGILLLNPTELTESQILIPAADRRDVDWASCNRLAVENRDFKEFINRLWEFFRTSNIRPEIWDHNTPEARALSFD